MKKKITKMQLQEMIHEGVQKLHEADKLKKKFEDIVNMKRLEDFADGILKVCLGEYGHTYIDEENMKISICLGDGSPFKSYDTIKWWMEEMLLKNYDDKDLIDIEIDSEWAPSGKRWDGKKWKK